MSVSHLHWWPCSIVCSAVWNLTSYTSPITHNQTPLHPWLSLQPTRSCPWYLKLSLEHGKAFRIAGFMIIWIDSCHNPHAFSWEQHKPPTPSDKVKERIDSLKGKEPLSEEWCKIYYPNDVIPTILLACISQSRWSLLANAPTSHDNTLQQPWQILKKSSILG